MQFVYVEYFNIYKMEEQWKWGNPDVLQSEGLCKIFIHFGTNLRNLSNYTQYRECCLARRFFWCQPCQDSPQKVYSKLAQLIFRFLQTAEMLKPSTPSSSHDSSSGSEETNDYYPRIGWPHLWFLTFLQFVWSKWYVMPFPPKMSEC